MVRSRRSRTGSNRRTENPSRARLALLSLCLAGSLGAASADLAGAASAKQPTPATDAADLVLRRGRLYTVSSQGTIEGSLAVKGGRIVALGADDAVGRLIGPKTRVVELGGRALTPGWIDAHSHLVGLGRDLVSVDLRGASTYDELIRRVVAATRDLPQGTWIFGRGWDQNLWPDREFPHHAALSRATAQYPVWLTRVDGHAVLVNQAAMSRLEVTDAVSDPPGGRFVRDAEKHLTGVLVDNATDVAGARLPPPTDDDLRRAVQRGAAAAAALGLTTVTDMGVGAREVAAYEGLAANLPLRVAAFLTDDKALLDAWFARGPLHHPSGKLTIRGVKLYADGALGSRGAALVEPYSDEPANLGLLVTETDHMTDVSRRAVAAGFQVGIHAIGDRGNLIALDALESALAGSRPQARCRIEHAQVMRLQDIDRMARLGVIASVQPTHATSDMPWAERRVGPRRIEGAYAWQRMIDAGVRLALGSDFPVELPDPLLGLYAAVTRQDLRGQPSEGWRAKEKLTREEALRGFTLDAAYSVFLEDQVGSLEVGKRADLVVFDRDPMTVAESEIPAVKVDVTVVDGAIVYQRGERPAPRPRGGGARR
jgi:predicted amidohydrolase YtcJ